MSRFLLTISTLALHALLACSGGSSPARVTTTPADPAAAADAADCPMDVAGTSVTAEDTPTGGALIFVTTGDATDLRARIGRWADAHNAHHGAMGPLPTGDEAPAAGGHDHHHGGGAAGEHAGHGDHAGGGAGEAFPGSTQMFQTMIGIHSRAAATDIDGGARLELITFPDQIGALRDDLRGHVSHLSSMGCAMHVDQ